LHILSQYKLSIGGGNRSDRDGVRFPESLNIRWVPDNVTRVTTEPAPSENL